MIYRIVLTLGYRDAYIDFTEAEEASTFAATLLEHYTKPTDEKKTIMKVVIEVLSSDYNEEEDN